MFQCLKSHSNRLMHKVIHLQKFYKKTSFNTLQRVTRTCCNIISSPLTIMCLGFWESRIPIKINSTSYWCVYCMKSYSKLTEALISEVISDHINVHFFSQLMPVVYLDLSPITSKMNQNSEPPIDTVLPMSVILVCKICQ